MSKKELWQLDKVINKKKEIVLISPNKKEIEKEYKLLLAKGVEANMYIRCYYYSID